MPNISAEKHCSIESKTLYQLVSDTQYKGEQIMCTRCKVLETEMEAELGSESGNRKYSIDISVDATAVKSAF